MKGTRKKKIVDLESYESDMKEIKKVLEYLVSKANINNGNNDNNISKTAEIHMPTESTQTVENVSEPMVFNILRKTASDVVTIKCRINKLTIPTVVLDSGANCSIMSKNIAKKLGLDIDTSRPTSLEGVATESDAIGWVYGIPISIGFFTLVEDFIIVDDNKPALLLGTPWLDRAQALIDFKNRILYVGNSTDLLFNVPISVHKKKASDIDTDNDKKKST